jgi:hypothetical protein
VLLVFVQYCYNSDVEEDLLVWIFTKQHNWTRNIQLCEQFITKNEISWEKCIDICTNGARAIVGRMKGVATQIKHVASWSSVSHCVLHRHALATRKLPGNLKIVLHDAVQITNFVKSWPLQSQAVQNFVRGNGKSSYSTFVAVMWGAYPGTKCL